MYKNVRKTNKKPPPCLSWRSSSKYKIQKYKTQKYTMNTKVQNAKHKNPHLASPSGVHLNTNMQEKKQKPPPSLSQRGSSKWHQKTFTEDDWQLVHCYQRSICTKQVIEQNSCKFALKLCIYAKVVQTCALLPRPILH